MKTIVKKNQSHFYLNAFLKYLKGSFYPTQVKYPYFLWSYFDILTQFTICIYHAWPHDYFFLIFFYFDFTIFHVPIFHHFDFTIFHFQIVMFICNLICIFYFQILKVTQKGSGHCNSGLSCSLGHSASLEYWLLCTSGPSFLLMWLSWRMIPQVLGFLSPLQETWMNFLAFTCLTLALAGI